MSQTATTRAPILEAAVDELLHVALALAADADAAEGERVARRGALEDAGGDDRRRGEGGGGRGRRRGRGLEEVAAGERNAGRDRHGCPRKFRSFFRVELARAGRPASGTRFRTL